MDAFDLGDLTFLSCAGIRLRKGGDRGARG